SSLDSAGFGKWRSFSQSGLPENKSASHQTVPAAMASRSVSDIGGRTFRTHSSMCFEIWRRRQAMMGETSSIEGGGVGFGVGFGGEAVSFIAGLLRGRYCVT